LKPILKPFLRYLYFTSKMSLSSQSESDDDIPLSKLHRPEISDSKGKKNKSTVEPDSVGSTTSSSVKIKIAKNGNKRNGGSTQVTKRSSKKRVKVESMDDDDDDDYKPKKKVKKSKPSSSSSKKKKVPVKKEKVAKSAPVKNRELKKLDKAELLSHAMQSFLWWDAPEPPKGSQWVTMEHAGVSFTEPYVPHGVKMKYNGQEVDLSSVEEEAATFFAGMDPDGMHLGNSKTRPIFIKNFFGDFKKVLDKKHGIKSFEKCDFEAIRRHLEEQKIIKKAITDEQRKMNKAERNETMFKFGYAIVDGHLEKVGNYNMEPPGTFRGRGEHPKMGKLKQRVIPEQVFINLSECSRIPPCSVPGHAWGALRHDPQVQWLAQWKENINNQPKYMQLAAQSSFKGKSDRSKYNKAALLCENIDKIRASYKKKLKAKSVEKRQLATAMWVIDRLALRVGGEKDTEEEADTVGCCSLRVEHLHFDPNNEGSDSKEIELEFLGKDSMLYKQTIDFGATMYTEENGMGEQVYENFKSFCKNKKPTQEVFNVLTPTILNSHLKEIMEGLTAKVFRTYNASKTLQDQLLKTEQLKSWNSMSAAEKVVEYNNANREVAILCNHQKSVSKAQETQLENLSGKLGLLKKQKIQLKKILKRLNQGHTKDIPVKKDEKSLAEQVAKAVEKAKIKKEKAKTNEEKIAATEADEKCKSMKRRLADIKFNQAHLWDKVPTIEQVKKKIVSWTQKITKMELNLKHKDDNKEVSLGTSKLNYMDPRISVAWCKRNEVPIEKVFSKTLRDKFNWAMAVPPDWEFNAEVGKQG